MHDVNLNIHAALSWGLFRNAVGNKM